MWERDGASTKSYFAWPYLAFWFLAVLILQLAFAPLACAILLMGICWFCLHIVNRKFLVKCGVVRECYCSFNSLSTRVRLNGLASRQNGTGTYDMAIIVLTHHSSGTR